MSESARARTVLLVEDDATIREMIALCLVDEGYAVEQVADGQAAIEALDRRQPPPEHYCLVLLDMMLPKANGIEVLHYLTGLGAYVPVLAMSAHPTALAGAQAAGAREALAKPFDLDQLMAVVVRCCPR